MFRFRQMVAVLALSLAAGGCGIGCEDVQSIRVATLPGFQVTPAEAAEPVGVALHGDVGHDHAGVRDFQRVYDALAMVRRDTRAVVMTVVGFETPPADRIVFSLALPADAETGDRYRVAGVFPPPIDREEEWGFRPRTAEGEVEVAFARTRPSIPDPPYDYVAHSVATAATGSVEVLRRDLEELLLEVDVVVSDAAGGSQRVAGRARVQLIDDGERCFSPA